MKYSVDWTDDAVSDIWELWSSTGTHWSISDAYQAIEHSLADGPLKEKHEVVNGCGTAICGSLGVDFLVDVEGRKIVITAAWPVNEGR